MKRNWILKADELPSAYEEVEILMVDGNIHKDMIVRGKYGNLEWRNFEDRSRKFKLLLEEKLWVKKNF